MKAELILTEAVRLVGIPNLDESLKTTGLTFINTALADVCLLRVESLQDNISNLTEEQLQAVISGTAMFVANALGLSDTRAAFSDDFHRRVAKLRCKTEKITDKTPKGDWL